MKVKKVILRRMDMDKELYCRDMGLDCDFVACGRTEEEVMRKADDHAQSVHHIQGFSQELYDKARTAIREGYCGYGDKEDTASEECSDCEEESFECGGECCC
jgi:predicted small metal-binding protein